ncbi:MAG: XRE family transcriptional regulator [Muribaculaceae bacterium]|nr:XRE family transcriptional regulator [Muribaculaceae bacterium]
MINIGKEIHDELLRQGHSVLWLSEQLECNRTNIYNIFSRESISTDLLLKISIALKKDFFALYSAQIEASAKDAMAE